MLRNSSFIFLAIASLGACQEAQEPITMITVKNEIVGQIPKELFGQFLEKPSWEGELGPEAALKPNSFEWQDGVVDLVQNMRIPLLRFPGGTDVDHMDWTQMIDLPNMEWTNGNRPSVVGHKGDTVGANFGYDEAGHLAGQLGADLMLVVNFGDAYLKRKPIEEAAMHEAALLAYCGAPLGVDFPGDLEKWPALREKNGHPVPYPVKYIQIANEPFILDQGVLKTRGDIPGEKREHFFQCAEAYIDLFKKVLPGAKIILDGNCQDIVDNMHARLGDKVDLVAYHRYYPWGIKEVKKQGKVIDRNTLTEKEVWQGWVAVPSIQDHTGFSVFDDLRYRSAVASGYPIALTEWNWNGWWKADSVNAASGGSLFTKAVGTAGFIHAMIRAAGKDELSLATQSMLVGNSWGITSIRVSGEESFSPYPLPTGQMTAFYANHFGEHALKAAIDSVETYAQPYRFNNIGPKKKVAYLDVLAARNDDQLFVYIINRHFDKNIDVKLDLSDFELGAGPALQKTLSGNLDNDTPCSRFPLRYACQGEKVIVTSKKSLNLTLTSRTVNILEISLLGTPRQP